jgi:hypothetical protein
MPGKRIPSVSINNLWQNYALHQMPKKMNAKRINFLSIPYCDGHIRFMQLIKLVYRMKDSFREILDQSIDQSINQSIKQRIDKSISLLETAIQEEKNHQTRVLKAHAILVVQGANIKTERWKLY